MTLEQKTLPVAAIQHGTVIDHIAAGQALKIIYLLKLANYRKQVTLGLNLPSETLDFKDIIKLDDRELTAQEAHQVAVLAPRATINIIQDYEVIRKFQVEPPEFIKGIFSCLNPRCITNNENVSTHFNISKRTHHLVLQCRFCEKAFSQHEIVSSML